MLGTQCVADDLKIIVHGREARLVTEEHELVDDFTEGLAREQRKARVALAKDSKPLLDVLVKAELLSNVDVRAARRRSLGHGCTRKHVSVAFA